MGRRRIIAEAPTAHLRWNFPQLRRYDVNRSALRCGLMVEGYISTFVILGLDPRIHAGTLMICTAGRNGDGAATSQTLAAKPAPSLAA
mgnify:CR=1 FL=1